MTNRKKWKHAGLADGYWTALFVGEQSGVAQAFKDCEVPTNKGFVVGLNKAQYQLASTGKVSPKLLSLMSYGSKRVF